MKNNSGNNKNNKNNTGRNNGGNAAEVNTKAAEVNTSTDTATEEVADVATPGTEGAGETVVTETAPVASTDRNEAMEETATEQPAAEGTAAPVIVNAAANAGPAVVKTRLFWQKACNDTKQSTNTEIKPGEVFVLTDKKVWILPDPSKPQNTTDNAAYEVPVYSMKRGKRIYYTFYVTPEQVEAATAAGKTKADAKAAADKLKDAEKAQKAAEKAQKAGATAAAVAAPQAAVAGAQPAASAAPAAEAISEEELEGATK